MVKEGLEGINPRYLKIVDESYLGNSANVNEILEKITGHLGRAKKTFTLGDVEYENAGKFAEEHESCKSESAMCEKFAYYFIPGSIGTNVHVECLICGKKENITDYDRW